MTSLINFASNLKLTLTQWLLLALAAIAAGLVIALKVQGTELHKLQVQLLEAHLAASLQKPQADVDAARARFQDALNHYVEAGGE